MCFEHEIQSPYGPWALNVESPSAPDGYLNMFKADVYRWDSNMFKSHRYGWALNVEILCVQMIFEHEIPYLRLGFEHVIQGT